MPSEDRLETLRQKIWQTRQTMKRIDPDQLDTPLFVLREDYPAFEGPWHTHRHAQLIYAADGLLTIRTQAGLWVVPPRRAVWILPGEAHQGFAPRPFTLKTLYLQAGHAGIPEHAGVITVDHLLDALLDEAAGFGGNYPTSGPEARICQVILDRLQKQTPLPSFLPSPKDPRLKTLTSLLEADLDGKHSLPALSTIAGMTSRTAARLFLKETGLSFSEWRQQLRLLRAIQSLSLGQAVSQVAAEVGYSDVSAFIQVFKSAFGDTPARYFRKSYRA